MKPPSLALVEQVKNSVNRRRLVDTAVQLVSIPSPTGAAGAAADCLAKLLGADGFSVERPTGGHTAAPAVAVRYSSGRPGKTLQFDGHIDTVHLPFVPPQVNGDLITGSGSCDMKGGVAAAVEALRVLREIKALPGGSILFTAHDLHEAPWGLGEQLNRLIRDGYVGDAVLLPEPLFDKLPVIGRGAGVWKVIIRRSGPPIHEVMRPMEEPNVIAAGAELIVRLEQLAERLKSKSDALAGHETVFIGQIHSGEIYNQYPQECKLEGTRRWLPDHSAQDVEQEFRGMLAELAKETRTEIDVEYRLIRDGFRLKSDSLVAAFQESFAAANPAGEKLPTGLKPFVDDGNSFWAIADVPAITHGPRSGGAHTLNEWVSIDDLVRVAQVYVLTAIAYCGQA